MTSGLLAREFQGRRPCHRPPVVIAKWPHVSRYFLGFYISTLPLYTVCSVLLLAYMHRRVECAGLDQNLAGGPAARRPKVRSSYAKLVQVCDRVSKRR